MDEQGEIKAIYAQIGELHKRRQDLSEKVKQKHLEEFKSLSWAQGLSYHFYEGFAAYGHKELKLIPTTKIKADWFDGLNNYETILGDSKMYLENLLIRKSEYGGYEFTTSNVNLLKEFLQKTNGKIVQDESIKEKLDLFTTLSQSV